MFVGRGRELAVLAGAWDATREGGSAVVDVIGEAGIGKTSLIGALLQSIDTERHVVLNGGCDQGWSAPYLCLGRAAAEFVDRRGIDSITGLHAPWLAQLSPRLDAALGHPTSPIVSEREGETARLIHAFVEWLSAQCARDSGVVVVDDLQWIDAESALLVRSLLSAHVPGLLLVLARRNTDLTGTPAETVTDATTQRGAHRIQLAGLDEGAVAELAASAGRHESDAAALRQRSDGNPLFLRALLDERDDTGTQATVSALFAGRLDACREDTQQVVRAVSVTDSDASIAVLADVTGQSEDDVITALEEARGAGLVAELAVDRWDFVHDVARQSVRSLMSAAQRARLHGRLASTLSRLRPGDHVALAHHHHQSGTVEGARDAIDHLVRAGDEAMTRVAFVSAHSFYTNAAELFRGLGPAADPAFGLELDLRIGAAAQRAGLEGWASRLRSVARAARKIDGDLLVRAVIAQSRGWHTEAGRVDEEAVALLEAALERVGPDDPRRAEVLATLATELTFSADRARPAQLTDMAVEIARRTAPPRVLMGVLDKAISTRFHPSAVGWRYALSRETVELADAHGDARDQIMMRFKRLHCLVELGQLDKAREDWRTIERLALDADDPWSQRTVRTSRFVFAVGEGRFDDAEAAANESAAIGNSIGMVDALTIFSSQVFLLHYLRGRLGEIVDLAEAAIDLANVPGFVAAHALARAEVGDLERASIEVAAVTPHLRDIVEDINWVSCLCTWTDVVHRVSDVLAADILYDLLAPYDDYVAYSNPILFGSMHRTIGKLQAVRGNLADAAEHLARAVEVNQRGGIRSFEAFARFEEASVLRAFGQPADFTVARAMAGELGMLGLLRDIDATAD